MEIRLEDYNFYIRAGRSDMRKSSVGLALIVQEDMGLRPFEKSVFLSMKKFIKPWQRKEKLCNDCGGSTTPSALLREESPTVIVNIAISTLNGLMTRKSAIT